MYIDGRPKASENVPVFINSTQLVKTTKQLNCEFEGCEEHRIFVCATKTILPGEELLIDYNLNRIDVASVGDIYLHTHSFGQIGLVKPLS